MFLWVEPLWMSIVLVNESGCGQLGKWSRCLIFSFSSPLWIGWLWDITPKLALWSDSFFPSLFSTVSSVNQSRYKISSYPEAPFYTNTYTWLCVWGVIYLFMHKLLPVCIEWVWSNSVPKGPWLRYPCHITPKDSQRSGSEGTEGPQMELHRLALLRPSAVISPYT